MSLRRANDRSATPRVAASHRRGFSAAAASENAAATAAVDAVVVFAVVVGQNQAREWMLLSMLRAME